MNLGVEALEGMACGCALLVSDGGGLPDAVGSAGLKFKRSDQQDLNLKLQVLVNNAHLRRQMRIDALEHLKSHTVTSVGKMYMSALKKVYFSSP